MFKNNVSAYLQYSLITVNYVCGLLESLKLVLRLSSIMEDWHDVERTFATISLWVDAT